MNFRTIRRRVRLKGGRTWKSGGFHPEVAKEIEREQRAIGCSLSYLITAIVTERYERKLGRRFSENPLPIARRQHAPVTKLRRAS